MLHVLMQVCHQFKLHGWALRTNTYLKKFQINSYFIHKYFSIISIEGQMKRVAPEYCCIAALRGLELKNNNPAMWNRLQLLMDHGDENKKSEMEYYEMFKVFLVVFITFHKLHIEKIFLNFSIFLSAHSISIF